MREPMEPDPVCTGGGNGSLDSQSVIVHSPNAVRPPKRTHMKRLILVLVLLASPSFAAEKLTLILDWFVNPNHGPIIVADELGYFADEGLEVEIIAPADPSLPAKTVAAGGADIAISYQQQLHFDIRADMPIKRVGTLIATPLNCLLVLADGDIASISDLAGRTIGFSVAGVDEVVIEAMLAPNGLSLSDVELVNVNWSLAPSLMSGQVDAVIGAARNYQPNQMALDGAPGRCFFVEEEGFPAYDELIFVAQDNAGNEKQVLAFLSAIERATQFIVNNPDQAFEVFAASSPELNDELNRLAWNDTIPRFALRPAALNHGRYAAYEAFLNAIGQTKEIRPASDFAIDLTDQ